MLSFKLTREGVYFLLLTCAVGFGSFNTGNSLLYMLLSAMLSLLVLSVVLADLSLRGLELWRRPPEDIHAGHEAFVTLGVRNRKLRLPSFNLAVRESFGRGRTLDPVSFPHIAARGDAVLGYRCVFPRRGRCRFRGWIIETTFPFGLVLKRRYVEGPDRALVFPALHPVASPPLSTPRPGHYHGVSSGLRSDPSGEDFFDLRPLRVGDDDQHIAWKASARRRQKLARGFEPYQAQGFAIALLDLAPPRRQDPLFETAVSYTASLAAHLLSLGHPVSLTTLHQHLPPAQGLDQHMRIMSALSTLRQTLPSDAGLQDALQKMRLLLSASPHQRVLISTPYADPWTPQLPCDAHVAIDRPELAHSPPMSRQPTQTLAPMASDLMASDLMPSDVMSSDLMPSDVMSSEPMYSDLMSSQDLLSSDLISSDMISSELNIEDIPHKDIPPRDLKLPSHPLKI
jgi:uncharacterized protein (DUF58 family)